MRVLLDTNILARLVQPAHPHHDQVLDALKFLRVRGDEPVVVPQVIYEFWVVCTRPAAENGLGMDTARAQADLFQIRRLFTLVRDERAIFQEWERLVVQHEVRGKTAHDARLVAAMLRHAISHLLTLNPSDFTRFPQINVLTPEHVVSRQRPKP